MYDCRKAGYLTPLIKVSLASHVVNSCGSPMQDAAVSLSWGGSAPVQVKHGWTDIWGMYGFLAVQNSLGPQPFLLLI